MKSENSLSELVAEIIARHSDEVSIHPTFIANEVMRELGNRELYPDDRAYIAAHLQFRSISRGLLNKKYQHTDDSQKELFDSDGLQRRYPVKHKEGEEPCYVLRDRLTPEDCEYIIQRMEKDIRGRERHLEKFKQWSQEKFRAMSDAG